MRRRDVIIGSAALLLSAFPRNSSAGAPNRNLIYSQADLTGLLLGELQQSSGRGGNIVLSPASLAAVLATLALGADDAMQRAIGRTLRLKRGVDLETVRSNLDDLLHNHGEDGAVFALANLIVVDPGAKPNLAVADRLRNSYTNVIIEDLSSAQTVDRINAWVSDQTKGFVGKVFSGPQGRIGLAGINALYFKGRWQDRFDPRLTERRPFQPFGSGSLRVPLMTRIGGYGYRESGRYVAIELPYKNGRFALTVVTTNDRPAAAEEFSRTTDWLVGENFEATRVDLSLPRFVVRTGVELLGALDAIGLKPERVSPAAFSPLCQAPQSLAGISQQAYLLIDEEGTEAAAATTVTTSRSAARAKTVTMVVDKPFVFALRDLSTGLILISGYIGRPPQPTAVADG